MEQLVETWEEANKKAPSDAGISSFGQTPIIATNFKVLGVERRHRSNPGDYLLIHE
jgi:hypothetical protein